jgi:hypothetical protein
MLINMCLFEEDYMILAKIEGNFKNDNTKPIP